MYARAIDPVLVSVEDRAGTPSPYRSLRNFPNPFGQQTTIEYALAEAVDVTIRIYDARGKLVTTINEGHRLAGMHTTVWNGTDHRGKRVSSGVYFYEMGRADTVLRSKMVVLR